MSDGVAVETGVRLARYQPVSDWPPIQAVIVTGLIVLAAVFIGSLTMQALVAQFPGLRGDVVWTIGALGLMQLTVLPLVWIAARRGGRRSAAVLALVPPVPGIGQVLLAMGGLLVLVVPYSMLVMYFAPESLSKDLKPFAEMMRSQWWWLVLIVVGLGAPLMEELLFRGFLMSSLAGSRLQYAGAAVISTAMWSALHYGYSLAGLVEVFLVGLYFCWLLWRSGSLWLPLICHGLYNSALVLLLLTGVIKI